MKLLKFDYSRLPDENRDAIRSCLHTWELEAFNETASDKAPLLLVYQSTPDIIARTWHELVGDVAISIQARLDSEFSRRNLTLMFICRGRLPINTLKLIRENTYCCKKVVIESQNICEDVINAYYLNAYSPSGSDKEIGPDGTLKSELTSKYVSLSKILEVTLSES